MHVDMGSVYYAVISVMCYYRQGYVHQAEEVGNAA